MANNIQIQIEAGTEDLIKGLDKADKAVVKFSGQMVSSFSPITLAANKAAKGITDGFKDAFNSIGKGVAIGNLVSNAIQSAASSITGFVSNSIAAAAENENAINKLSQALRASGSFSKEAVSSFADFADELERTSLFSAEAALEQIAFAKSLGLTNTQARNLVQAGANLAATFGGTLEDNVQKLGKSLNGSTDRLAKFIPELKGLTEEQLRAGAAADIVNSKFSGAAASQLDSYTGRVNTLSDAFGNFQEELGKFVTESETVSNITGFVSLGIEKLTQAIVDSRTESERQKEGFVETSSSLDQLQRKYNDLTLELLEYEEVVQKSKEPKNLINPGDLSIAQVRVRSLTAELASLQAQLDKGKTQVKANTPAEKPNQVADVQTKQEKDQAAKILADKAALNQQLIQQEAEFEAYRTQLSLERTTLTEEQRAAEYESLLIFENQKVEAVRQAELEKAAAIQDAGLRTATINAANQKADLAFQKNYLSLKDKQEKEGLARKKASDAAYIDAAQNFLQAGLVLAKEGSVAQKALQITQAVISTYTAANNALATVPYPANIAAAASMVTLGLANVAKIAGAKFEQGGIVGGSSYHGDKTPALVNAGEMILNRQQQGEMFRQLRSGGADNEDVADKIVGAISNMRLVVEANGREIARLVRDEKANGFAV